MLVKETLGNQAVANFDRKETKRKVYIQMRIIKTFLFPYSFIDYQWYKNVDMVAYRYNAAQCTTLLHVAVQCTGLM